MNICTDQNDFAIGITGLALDSSGLPIGTQIYFPALGRPSWKTGVDGGLIHQKAMAPIGAFQVVIVGNPNFHNGNTRFTAGKGTIAVAASPNIAPQNYWPNPYGGGTGENSNMRYDLVPSRTSHMISQPFGL